MTSKEIIDALHSLTSGESVSNEEIKRILQKHECYYLLEQMASPNTQLHMKMLINKGTVSARYRTCADLFEKLSDIPYAVIKGAVLSKEIYGSVAYRFSGDIDLLVSYRNLERVKKILVDYGFVQGRVQHNEISLYTRSECVYQKKYSHQLASFVKKTGEPKCPFVNVDVNYDIFWGEREQQTDMDTFLTNLKNTTIENVEVRKLAPEEEFISLCLHHYKDMNSVYLLSTGNLRLSLLCDIYFYLKNANMDMDLLLKKSRMFGATEYVYYCMYYTSVIFGSKDLQNISAPFRSEKADRLLDQFGLTEKERRTWKEPFEERLFSDNFSALYSAYLTDADYRKIVMNERYM